MSNKLEEIIKILEEDLNRVDTPHRYIEELTERLEMLETECPTPVDRISKEIQPNTINEVNNFLSSRYAYVDEENVGVDNGLYALGDDDIEELVKLINKSTETTEPTPHLDIAEVIKKYQIWWNKNISDSHASYMSDQNVEEYLKEQNI